MTTVSYSTTLKELLTLAYNHPSYDDPVMKAMANLLENIANLELGDEPTVDGLADFVESHRRDKENREIEVDELEDDLAHLRVDIEYLQHEVKSMRADDDREIRERIQKRERDAWTAEVFDLQTHIRSLKSSLKGKDLELDHANQEIAHWKDRFHSWEALAT